MGLRKFLLSSVFFLFFAGFGVVAGETGPEQTMLQGGERGDVPFNHKQHQMDLKDCNICHDTFPQKENSIQNLIDQGNLKSKQVMNSLCTKCHRDRKKAGLTTGPTTCTKCHTR